MAIGLDLVFAFEQVTLAWPTLAAEELPRGDHDLHPFVLRQVFFGLAVAAHGGQQGVGAGITEFADVVTPGGDEVRALGIAGYHYHPFGLGEGIVPGCGCFGFHVGSCRVLND